ncbi:hypothetical protein IR012_08360 [Pseudomonas putida]|uniref:DUF6602 domain-containing protein n=1 Tax=Pseudomonas putida TaxID=303 RepID=UPI0018ABB5BC|nr:DUF6602 domain-containing protein [Pseudomonas putida]MBF8669580.1 hypothetical protein [Pseudomonas putida]MBF8712329.1 hypothetical protein [Pseudomonas putida]
MNQAFSALLNEKIELFRHSFSAASRQTFVSPATGRLIHAGEFGTYREEILRGFLRLCVPARLEIGTGFLMNSEGGISTQADIVVYDPSAVPRIESNEHQRFFPVEGVCAIGEVKSRLSKAGLRDALNKLARAKATADHISSTTPTFRDRSITSHPFNREEIEYDQIFSILVCEGFDFDPNSLANEIGKWYETDIKSHHKHNMILSIENGIALYMHSNGKAWMYPPTHKSPAKNRFLAPNENKNLHLHLFCSYMFLATSSATILYPEITKYMPPLAGGLNYDEESE